MGFSIEGSDEGKYAYKRREIFSLMGWCWSGGIDCWGLGVERLLRIRGHFGEYASDLFGGISKGGRCRRGGGMVR